MADYNTPPPHEVVADPAYWQNRRLWPSVNPLTDVYDHGHVLMRGSAVWSAIGNSFSQLNQSRDQLTVSPVAEQSMLPVNTEPTELVRIVEDSARIASGAIAQAMQNGIISRLTRAGHVNSDDFDSRAARLVTDPLYGEDGVRFYDDATHGFYRRNVRYAIPSASGHQLVSVTGFDAAHDIPPVADVWVETPRRIGQTYETPGLLGPTYLQKIVAADVIGLA